MKESLHFAGLPRHIPAQCNSAASSAVVARPLVVVVGSTVLTGAGGGSVVVVVDATGLDGSGVDGCGGLVGLVGRVGRGLAGRPGVAGPWAPGTVGAIPGGDCGPGSVVKADDPVLALEGAGPVGRSGTVVGGGIGGTPEEPVGSSGTKAVEATIAAATAKVSPKATSIRRQDGRCSARWRGLGGGMARRRASWGRSLRS
jgi:hypothetical protein